MFHRPQNYSRTSQEYDFLGKEAAIQNRLLKWWEFIIEKAKNSDINSLIHAPYYVLKAWTTANWVKWEGFDQKCQSRLSLSQYSTGKGNVPSSSTVASFKPSITACLTPSGEAEPSQRPCKSHLSTPARPLHHSVMSCPIISSWACP